MKNLTVSLFCSIILTGCVCECAKEHINSDDISNIIVPVPLSNVSMLEKENIAAPIPYAYPSKKVLIDKCHIHCINCKIHSESE
jgi:hypothetical protein